MKFFKAFLFTFFYCVLFELSWPWHYISIVDMDSVTTIEFYDFISSCVFLLLLIIIFKTFKRKDVLRFKKTNPEFCLSAMLLGIVFVFFQAVLNIIYHFELAPEFFSYEFTLQRLNSFDALSTILIIPITEELFFRNYLQRELMQKYKPYLAIFLASLLFAFIHLQLVNSFLNETYLDWHHTYITIFGGYISGILLYKSKSIIPSILFHICWNLTVTVV